MRKLAVVLIVVATTALLVSSAMSASAQRLPFERSFDVKGPTILDVSTERGKIDVTVGEQDHIVVSGTVTIRIGLGCARRCRRSRAQGFRTTPRRTGGTHRPSAVAGE